MNLALNRPTRLVPVPPAGEQLIVRRLEMANMSGDGQTDSPFIEILRSSRAPNTAAVLQAGVLGNGPFHAGRAVHKQLSNSHCKSLHVFSVEFDAPLRLPLSTTFARVAIGQTFVFGALQPLLLDQHTLPLVAAAGAAPLEDDGRQRRVLSRSARQRGIAGRQEVKVVEVGAGQAQCVAVAGKGDPGPTAQ